tara:strand:+ start:1640 stop:2401 length:762 start_codon:yes stop_codon:yes gene_type:complete
MKISFVCSPKHDRAVEAYNQLIKIHEDMTPEKADVFVILGGDGTMLHALHALMRYKKPFYGMNLGTVGFLMNPVQIDGLCHRIKKAVSTKVNPLLMRAECVNGQCVKSHAFNEVSFLRQTHQAAKMKVWIDGIVRLEELIADGILLSTSAGSTAYNLSNKGPILPIDSGLLVLTPISPFRPRHWQSVLLKETVDVTVDIQSPQTRPVSATADFIETRGIQRVRIHQDQNAKVTLLFDPEGSLEERTLQEQFRA